MRFVDNDTIEQEQIKDGLFDGSKLLVLLNRWQVLVRQKLFSLCHSTAAEVRARAPNHKVLLVLYEG